MPAPPPALPVHTATLHGHELSYLDSGSGHPVLLIHGLLGSHQNWAHLVDRMDDDHRVLIPDLFGHGSSAKPVGDYSLGAHAATLRDLLDRLQVPATPYLMAVDGAGTIVAATLPDPDTDLTGWVRRARGPVPLAEEQA